MLYQDLQTSPRFLQTAVASPGYTRDWRFSPGYALTSSFNEMFLGIIVKFRVMTNDPHPVMLKERKNCNFEKNNANL